MNATDLKEPTFEAVLEQFKGSGLEALSKVGEQAAELQDQNQRELKRAARAMHNTFSTPDGQRTLELLLDLTLRRATWMQTEASPFKDLKDHGVFREGQNSVAAIIVKYLNVARDEIEKET